MPTNKAATALAQVADFASQSTTLKANIADNAASLGLAELQKFAMDALCFDFLSDRLSEYNARYAKTKGIMAAGTTGHTDVWDLTALHLAASQIALLVEIPAMPNLPDGETLTIQMQHSDDNSSYSNVGSAVRTRLGFSFDDESQLGTRSCLAELRHGHSQKPVFPLVPEVLKAH